MDIATILYALGWGGALCAVTGYGLLTAGRLSSTSRLFQGLNIVGSVTLCSSALVSAAWSSAAVNAIWALIGIQAWIMFVRKAKRGQRRPHLVIVEPAPVEVLADTLVMDIIDTARMPLAS